MSLRIRFLLSLLAVLALMAVPAVYGVSRVDALRDIALELQEEAAQSSLAVGRLQDALGQADRFQRAYVATADPELALRTRTSLREAAAELARLRSAGYGVAVEEVEVHVGRLQDVAAGIEQLVEAGMLDSATVQLVSYATPVVQRARDVLPQVAARIDANTQDRVALAHRAADSASTTATLALAVALALACVLGVGAASALTRPVERLKRAMAGVAEGRFEAPDDLPYERTDELGHLSRSFRSMARRLAELDRLKAEFVGTASHDLKTPISIITGYAELMEEELGGSLELRHRELLRALAEQTHTLRRRVDQLLEISRMEAGRLQLGLEEINLRHFMEEVQRMFVPAAHMRGLRLELRVHERAQPFLIADPDVLRTDILGNLLGNALKFTPAGGVVSLGVDPDGDRLHIEVADTGPGIPPEQVGRVFEKYFQGHGASGGAGLGLAIARAAVEAHGGRLDVWSRPGHGTRFRATLPVRAIPPARPAARHPA